MFKWLAVGGAAIAIALPVTFARATDRAGEDTNLASSQRDREVVQLAAAANEQIPTGPAVTTQSGPAELALVKYLKQQDIKMYGAYWCPHCYIQKQLFGAAATRQLTYIECATTNNTQAQICKEAGIRGYPTWEINGELYPGVRSLSELANLAGYKGRNDFQNDPTR